MGIGTSLVLIAVGAILKYAVTANVSGVKLEVVGVVLMVIGLIGLVVSLLYLYAWSDRRRRVVEDRTVVEPRYRDRY